MTSAMTAQHRTYYTLYAEKCLNGFTTQSDEDWKIVGLALKTIAENKSLFIPTQRPVLQRQIIRFSEIVEKPKNYLSPDHYTEYKNIFLEQIRARIDELEKKYGTLVNFSEILLFQIQRSENVASETEHEIQKLKKKGFYTKEEYDRLQKQLSRAGAALQESIQNYTTQYNFQSHTLSDRA